MSPKTNLLVVIPARGGSKGLPGKNIRPFLGIPLMAHTILFARMCPPIDRLIVSTDSKEIAAVALEYGAEVPFLRPSQLAQDDTPMWPVLRHALETMEGQGSRYTHLLLLDPTSPFREPSDLAGACERLNEVPEADGIIGVSRPFFNPLWHCVVEEEGWMKDLFPEGHLWESRQETPAVYRINGSIYLWKTEFLHRENASWRKNGRHLLFEMPETRAVSIDTQEEFERAELLVRKGLVSLSWLKPQPIS